MRGWPAALPPRALPAYGLAQACAPASTPIHGASGESQAARSDVDNSGAYRRFCSYRSYWLPVFSRNASMRSATLPPLF